jgi:hypothetical protein
MVVAAPRLHRFLVTFLLDLDLHYFQQSLELAFGDFSC